MEAKYNNKRFSCIQSLTFSKQVLVVVVKSQPFLWGVLDALFYLICDVVGIVYCLSVVVVFRALYKLKDVNSTLAKQKPHKLLSTTTTPTTTRMYKKHRNQKINKNNKIHIFAKAIKRRAQIVILTQDNSFFFSKFF